MHGELDIHSTITRKLGSTYLPRPPRDSVQWDGEQERLALERVSQNSATPLPPSDSQRYEDEAGHYWDGFYQQHQNRWAPDSMLAYGPIPRPAFLKNIYSSASRCVLGGKLRGGFMDGKTVCDVLLSSAQVLQGSTLAVHRVSRIKGAPLRAARHY